MWVRVRKVLPLQKIVGIYFATIFVKRRNVILQGTAIAETPLRKPKIMKSTPLFLRRLQRFNEEVRRCFAPTLPGTGNAALPEQFALCENAARELQDTHQKANAAWEKLQHLERLLDAARSDYQQAEIEERIVRAHAETQVWSFLSISEHATHLTGVWEQEATRVWHSEPDETLVYTPFFSVVRAHDTSYSLWTFSRPRAAS